MSSRSYFGFKFAEIFVVEKRLPDSGESGSRWLSDSPSRRVVYWMFKRKLLSSVNRRVVDSPNRRVGESPTRLQNLDKAHKVFLLTQLSGHSNLVASVPIMSPRAYMFSAVSLGLINGSALEVPNKVITLPQSFILLLLLPLSGAQSISVQTASQLIFLKVVSNVNGKGSGRWLKCLVWSRTAAIEGYIPLVTRNHH